ncbi:MCE family protein [Haloechinothrix sp. YIM 98757]|uniref:MCE family protein n=1 Tax=Haloechinothrix aidingensis TaxID=2752311 RepID=A0A838ACF7_9PSEU|nr:MCE family protein [Haloechinothrix aidingensis]MBA0126956.1 MCE family protein [Haloechinothrix aidingensis]
MSALARRLVLVPVALVCAVVLAACGEAGFSGLYNAPLPGGADVGEDPYRVTAEFDDVLDLVPHASVRVNDVSVGRVDHIELAEDTKSAEVTMTVNGDVELPANAEADLRQSSLLGEKFVELREPEDGQAKGTLADGATIPIARTSRGVELEEVLGALSLLLSGGGIDQLRDIAEELNAAMSGNEPEIKALLSHAEELTRSLDGQKGEIVRAIDGLDELSGTLRAENDHLATALDELEPGLRVVSEQRDELVNALDALDALSDVTVDTIERSRDQVVENLRALEPVLRKLAEAEGDLIEALKILPTYPLPWNAGDVVKGDYANVDVEFELKLDKLIDNIRNSSQPPLGLFDAPGNEPQGGGEQAEPGGGSDGDPNLPELPLPPSGSDTDGSTGGDGGLPGLLLGGR